MKRLSLLIALVVSCLTAYASELKYDSTATAQTFETRVAASFTKHFKRAKMTLGIEEELRLQMYNQVAYSLTNGAEAYRNTLTPDYFRRSYTTISWGYKPIDYFSMNVGYTLKLLGDKQWNDPKEFMRHRVMFALSGHYKVGGWKFGLRERLDVNCRMDSVNSSEKAKVDLRLRHRLHVSYGFYGKPVRLFMNFELINTLNQPLAYLNEAAGTNYKQYLSDIRTQLGVKWKVDAKNALSFAYRFYYGNELDINITKNAGNVELMHEKSYGHIIAINYEFDW